MLLLSYLLKACLNGVCIDRLMRGDSFGKSFKISIYVEYNTIGNYSIDGLDAQARYKGIRLLYR